MRLAVARSGAVGDWRCEPGIGGEGSAGAAFAPIESAWTRALGSLGSRVGGRTRNDCARALNWFWLFVSHIWIRFACLSTKDLSVSFSSASSSRVLRPVPRPAGMLRCDVTCPAELRDRGRRELVGEGGPTFS